MTDLVPPVSLPTSHDSSAPRPRRLGLLAHKFSTWGGGIDFLRMVASSLHHAAPDIELHVVAPLRGPRVLASSMRDFASELFGGKKMHAHRPSVADLERALVGTGAVLHLIDSGADALARATRRLKLDAMLPAIAPHPDKGTPWVGYVFDFQHKHLPQFFTAQESALRDIDFRRMLDEARVAVVNARDVVKDVDHYFPNRRASVVALPFCPSPGSDSFAVDVEDARRRHGIDGPYFIVCNQFWKHKDHGTAFKAFAAVVNRYPELSLICTGATSDYRFPEYFGALMHAAEHDGVAHRIRVLGLIPKHDQLALIRGAVALVQPTLFEGGPGGGAVYDAVALGQHAIVSNIPVNTEITDPEVTFFSAGDADALSEAMSAAWQEHGKRAPPLEPAELIARGIERRRACGEVLLQAIALAMLKEPSTDHHVAPSK